MQEIKIRMNGISKSYSTPVLENICLNIDNDSFFAIQGESGSGKSTLMNILGLIENFDSGEYYFNGLSIKPGTDYSRIRLYNIGFIFQSYHLIPTLTCRENIMLPLLYGRSKRVLDDVVDSLNISALLDRKVNVLSGGEKQRVAIARALMLDPGLIIADEPTGNLDEMNKKYVFDLLRREHDYGRAIVMITHDSDTAAQAEKVYELKGGRLHDKT